MSVVAQAAAWVTAVVVGGWWAWHHGIFNGANVLAILIAATFATTVWALHDIDLGNDRLFDPRPMRGEDRR